MTPDHRHLTKEQADAAYARGALRNQGHESRGVGHKYGLERNPALDQHRHGMAAMAEATVAAMLRSTWDQSIGGADDGSDVGGRVGVRWTPLDYGCLLLHDSDRNDVPQVLVIGTAHPLRVVGWAWPDDVRLPKFWRERGVRNPAYFVPQSFLRTVPELIAWASKL